MTLIPIVFAANDSYAPYLGVAISSLIRHASSENIYRIFILETDISIQHKKRMEDMQRKNVTITFRNVQEEISEWEIPQVNHLSPETTYRLLIDKIFPNYEKVVYLDTDLVILHDIADLYNEQLDDDILACSRARLVPDLAAYIKNQLDFPIADYFNPGVMLVNIPAFIRAGIGNRGLDMLSAKRYFTQDQDVLNLLCHHQVKYLDPRWNVEWGHLTGKSGDAVIDDVRQGSLEAVNDPYIIHYSTFCKPWAHPEIPLAEFFWEEARKTCFYEEILLRNSAVLREEEDIFRWFVFPWHLIQPRSNIILYGAGVVGNIFYEQLQRTQYANVVLVCDKSRVNLDNMHAPTATLGEFLSRSDISYESIVIAVKRKSVANEIRQELLGGGIPEYKILWDSPLRHGTMELDGEGRICQ